MKNLKIGTVLLFLIGVISFTSCEKEDKERPIKAIIKSTLRIVYFFVKLKNINT